MAGNPFDDANALVGGLKTEYDQLIAELPKLREQKKAGKADLEALDRRTVEVQTKLDDLLEQIRQQTEAYNTWQTSELAKLESAKKAFVDERYVIENDLAAREQKIREDRTALDADKRAVEVIRQRVKDTEAAVMVREKANHTWFGQLSQQETDQKAIADANNSTKAALDVRSRELDMRETALAEAEKTAATNVKSSESDRSIARTILSNAKERIANLDAREDNIEQQATALERRKRDLDSREAGLNDRRDVMISNGTLKV